mgnify:CR=1 FL=1
MMKILLVLSTLLVSTLLLTKYAVAGEIVDTEWTGNFLTITYSPARGWVECTAYNSSGAAIGGGEGLATGTVARVLMSVPEKYAHRTKRESVKVACRPAR